MEQLQADHFTKALYALLDETFDNVHGLFLDKGTSMFETLALFIDEPSADGIVVFVVQEFRA